MGILPNFKKAVEFNLCLIDAEENRKKISEKKRIQAQPYLDCLNEFLSEENNPFYYWGSAAHDMCSEKSDVDIIFMPNQTTNIKDIDQAIMKCGGKLKEQKDNCNTYRAYTHQIDDLKIDTSIQLCKQIGSYDIHCMQHTTEDEKDMIWCLNSQLKAGIPKQKLIDKSILIDYPSYFNTCDFTTKTKK